MALDEQIRALRTEVQTLSTQAKTLFSEVEAAGDKATADDRTKLNNLIDLGKAKADELRRLQSLQETDQLVNQPAGQGKATLTSIAGQRPRKSWGQRVVTSEQFKEASQGAARSISLGKMPRMEKVNVKAPLYEGTEATGGALIQEMREDQIIDLPFRPRSVLDLINASTTDSNAVEYVVIDTRTNNAAEVAEYTGGNFGLKPESGMTFDLKSELVKTIATWIPVSRNILRDAPNLQNLIDTQLTEMLRVRVENQIVAGDGVGENFRGILNTTGILTRTHQDTLNRGLAGDNFADTIRRAITDVILEFYQPDGILLNPIAGENIELAKGTDGHYLMIRDATTGRLWRLPVYDSPVIAADRALVGAWQIGATIWDRMETEIRVGEPTDFFLRNAAAVLAELRAAFGVVRPKAFCAVDFTP